MSVRRKHSLLLHAVYDVGLIGASLFVADPMDGFPPGALFFAGFAGIGSGARSPWINLGFTATVVLVWVWISALAFRLLAGRRVAPVVATGLPIARVL